jgi:hypothetical protein
MASVFFSLAFLQQAFVVAVTQAFFTGLVLVEGINVVDQFLEDLRLADGGGGVGEYRCNLGGPWPHQGQSAVCDRR